MIRNYIIYIILQISHAECINSSTGICGCREDKYADYTGTQHYTISGKRCVDWVDTLYSDQESNYCRNPNGAADKAWCFTDLAKNEWDYCNIRDCECPSSDVSTCGCKKLWLADYRGNINVTRTGKKCQAWASQKPWTHNYNLEHTEYRDAGLEENYCRNPSIDVEMPWCYVADGSEIWDYCDVPECGVTSTTTTTTTNTKYSMTPCQGASPGVCGCLSNRMADYTGMKNHTEMGYKCVPWSIYGIDEESNYCRNPNGLKAKAWCYIDDDDTWRYCDIPECGCENWNEDCGCPHLSGADYKGSIDYTEEGQICEQWQSHKAYNKDKREFHDSDLSGNQCRNPNMVGERPWCLVKGNVGWKYCDVPLCKSGRDSQRVPKMHIEANNTPITLASDNRNKRSFNMDSELNESLLNNNISKIVTDTDYKQESNNLRFDRKEYLN